MQLDQISQSNQEYLMASEEAMKDAPGPSFAVVTALGSTLIGEFSQAENDRRATEQRWLQDLRQYRGQYDPDILAKIGKDRSQAFVRKTRVKVNTTDARMMDLLFPSNNEKNFVVMPTPKPTVPQEIRQQIESQILAAAQGQPVDPAMIEKAVRQVVDEAAKKMASTIDDQLVEARYKDVSKQVIHSGNLYGTGILKAPLVEKKVRTRFVNENGKWVMRSEEYITPFVDFVPLWRWYPDMAATTLDDCRYVYERHLMTKAAMLKLAERKSFNNQRIIDYVMANPDGVVKNRDCDSELRSIGERSASDTQKTGQYEVLERWGWLEASSLISVGVNIPQERAHETFFSNVWLLPNGEVIRATIQPINGVTWPYHVYYFDKDETSIFGEGLSAVMRDDQTMINAGVRMILDNAALTAGPQIEANMSLLARGERAEEIIPFKIWPRTGIGEDARSPALRVVEMPSHIQELSAIVSMFENNADEVTAIPRYLYAENPTNGAAGTMGGLSMLMGAAAIVIKDLIGNYDEGVTKNFINALYKWNMQFNSDDSIKGDFDIKANGVASLVAKEVRAQQLDQFSQMCANPMDAPFIKREVLLRQRAEAHEIADVVKTEEEVMEEMNNPQAQAQQQMAQMQQQLMIAQLEKTVAKLEAEVGRITADAMRIRADAVARNVGAAYSAMQAGGVVAQAPGIAPVGDEILRSAGWQDQTPEEQTPDTQVPPGQIPPDVQTPQVGGQVMGPQEGMQVGMQQGIETEQLNG